MTSYDNKFRGNQKEVQIGQLTKPGNGKFKWDEIYEWNGWNAMIKCRKNDIKMMLNLGGNLGII